MIYLHENGVTVVASDKAKRGKVYELNGEEYYIAKGVSDIKRIIDSGEYPLNRVVTSKLKNLNYLFQIPGGYYQAAVPEGFNDDITNWDTSNVLSMEEVFSGWPTFNQDISNWDTSKVESMHGMFKSSKYVGNYYMGPTSFNQDISKWNVSNVKNMSEMFLGATSFNQDLNGWDVGNVENMDYMFSGATSFNQDLSNWDVSNVNTMCGMFSDVVAIGIIAFVGTFQYTRAGSTSFNQPIGNWDVSNVENMSSMFSGATSFNQDLSKWDVSNVEDMSYMFSGGRNGEWDNEWQTKKHSAILRENAKNNPTSFNQDIRNWDVSNVKNMGGMFSGATSFNQPIGNWNVSKVGSMIGMFSGATSFNQDLNEWNVSSLSWVEDMFYGATSFNSPIGKWKLKSQSNMSTKNMFNGATSFNQDLNGWDMSKVENMGGMFSGGTSFNQDISNWDVSNVTQMKGLFQDATSFNQDLRNWKLNEKLPKSRTMFQGATAFNIKEYSPFLNIKPKERKVDTSTADLSTEDKRTYSKIKKLIVSRDTDKIDLGIELAVSLNNTSIFSSLLVGCKLTQTEGTTNITVGEIETKLVTNKLFTGSGPAQPYLNYALLSLIANVPENDEIEIDESIKIKNITLLNLQTISFKHDWQNECKQPDISNFIYLKKLITSNSIPIQSTSSPVTDLNIKDFSGSLELLSKYTKLEHLTLSIDSYSSDKLESIDSFKHLSSLRELILSPGGKLTDINFLSECKNLQKLSLTIYSSYSSYGDEKIKDISFVSDLKNLEELSIIGIDTDLDISPIGNCKNLKNLDLAFDSGSTMPDLSMLNSLNELLGLNISGCLPYDFNSKIENINEIKLPKNLTSIKINNGSSYNDGITITDVNGGSLPKTKSKLLNTGEQRVNVGDTIDIGAVTHYRDVPFTGIMNYTFREDTQIEEELEMLKGFKHGSYKHFYVGGELTGKLRIEHNFIDDNYEKIIGFYDGYGNNYIVKNTCIAAYDLELLDKDKRKLTLWDNVNNVNNDNPTGLEGALFFHNNNLFSGQVFLHQPRENEYFSLKESNRSLYGIVYGAIQASDIKWRAPINNDYISFLITIKEGRITGEFCASSDSNFFSGTTDIDGTFSPICSLKVKDLSNDNPNKLSLKDKSIVVTGVFEDYSRNELKALIKENGGNPSSSVSTNTFLILAGDKMGPKKKKLAEELGVKIIDINSFEEKFLNKGVYENTENSFIDIFYSENIKNKTTSKNKLKSEDKKTFTKIKSLLTARDFDKIDMGIELLRSINIIEFYETLLAHCKIINEVDKQDLIYNKLFKGSGPAQPYLNYALYLLIYYCPDEANVDESLKKKNINKLKTMTFFPYSYDVKYRLSPIENFTSLHELDIDLSSFDLDYLKLEDVLKNSSVVKMRLNNAEVGGWLKNFPQLEYLSAGQHGVSAAAKDLHVFEYLTNLEELEINCPDSENIDFLKNCVKIKKLNLDLRGNYSVASKVKNIDALKHLTILEELDIKVPENKQLESFSHEGLSYCKKLKNLIINSDAATNVLANLKSCSALEKLDLKSKDEFNISLSTSNFYGLNKFVKLKRIKLDDTTFKF